MGISFVILQRCLLMAFLCFASMAHALVLEGVGHANIHHNDLDAARAEARKAAMRDLALQYEAQVSTRDTVENGVLTESKMQVAASARVRNARIVDEYRSGNLLRVVVRADMSEGRSGCSAGDAARLKKRVAVTGFPLLDPDQGRVGRIDDAGQMLPQQLQARLRDAGSLQVFSAAGARMFDDLPNAPTVQQSNNQLDNVLQLAREMGVQFVVTGVIRDLRVADPDAWGSSMLDRFQRSIGAVDQNRRFVVDLMIFDGFSGSPIYQKRFSTSAEWNAGPGASTGFGSGGFQKTAYGQAVETVIADMAQTVTSALACQPFMTRITRADGQNLTLSAGATAGLRPGDELHLYRSARYFDSPSSTPELNDSGITVTLDNVHPDFSNGRMQKAGSQVNIQRNDIAIVW
jgi:hypothetical protein